MTFFLKIVLQFFLLISITNGLIYSKTQNELLIDSLMSVIDKNELDTNQVKAYIKLSEKLRRSDPEKSIEYVKKGIELSKKLNWKLGTANAELNLGVFYAIQNDNPKALEYFHKALKYHEDMNDEIQCSKIYNNLSILYKRLENYQKAIEYVEKALEINIRLDRKKGMKSNFNSLGIIHRLLKNHDMAIDYFQKSLKISISLGDKTGQAQCLGNLGVVYSDKEENDKAVEFYLKALNLNKEFGDKVGIANSHFNIAGQYLGLYEDLNTDNENTNQRTVNKTTMINEMIKHYKISLDITKSLGLLHLRESGLFNLAKAYSFKNEHALAYKTLMKYQVIHDSLVNVESNKVIADLEAKRENELKQKEIVILKKTVDYQTSLTYFLIVASVLILIILVILYFSYRNKRKTNLKLEAQNELISKANIELEALNKDLAEKNQLISKSESDLKELNATKDKFFSIIAHDLKNPIGSFKQITEIMSEDYEDFSEEEKIDFINTMKDSSKNLFNLLENLLTWSRSQRGAIECNPERTNLAMVINNTLGHLLAQAKAKKIELKNNVPEEVNAKIDANLTSTVIRNLVSNSIKYSKEDSKIEVYSVNEEGKLVIEIRDYGVGMDEETKNKLFRIDSAYSTPGTGGEKGTGLGLIVCREFIEKQGGKIWVESEIGKGSSFFFTLMKD